MTFVALVNAGDCKLEYDRATGCYLDHAQLTNGSNAPEMFTKYSQASNSVPLLPEAGLSYDDALSYAVSGSGNASDMLGSSDWSSQPSSVDRVFQKNSTKPQRQSTHEHAMQPRAESARQRQIDREYDATDPQPGDDVQVFKHGQLQSVH